MATRGREAARYRAYADALNKCSLLAQRDLARLWERAWELPPGECRDVLLALVPGIVDKHARMAALAAAHYYEGERAAAGGAEGFAAELSEGVPLEQIEASVRFACGHLFPEGDDGIRPEPDGGLFGGQGR